MIFNSDGILSWYQTTNSSPATWVVENNTVKIKFPDDRTFTANLSKESWSNFTNVTDNKFRIENVFRSGIPKVESLEKTTWKGTFYANPFSIRFFSPQKTDITIGSTGITPGTIQTSSGGWTLKAKINGKDWVASSIMPPETAGRIIGYYDKEYIGLPYDRRYFVVGKKIVFGEDQAVDLSTNNEIGMWEGRKGEMEITKVDGDWAEGKFYFAASSTRSPKTIEVANGFFRISLAKTP